MVNNVLLPTILSFFFSRRAQVHGVEEGVCWAELEVVVQVVGDVEFWSSHKKMTSSRQMLLSDPNRKRYYRNKCSAVVSYLFQEGGARVEYLVVEMAKVSSRERSVWWHRLWSKGIDPD